MASLWNPPDFMLAKWGSSPLCSPAYPLLNRSFAVDFLFLLEIEFPEYFLFFRLQWHFSSKWIARYQNRFCPTPLSMRKLSSARSYLLLLWWFRITFSKLFLWSHCIHPSSSSMGIWLGVTAWLTPSDTSSQECIRRMLALFRQLWGKFSSFFSNQMTLKSLPF